MGSLVAVLGWLVASFGFRLYVAHFGAYAYTYGALGTFVIRAEAALVTSK